MGWVLMDSASARSEEVHRRMPVADSWLKALADPGSGAASVSLPCDDPGLILAGFPCRVAFANSCGLAANGAWRRPGYGDGLVAQLVRAHA